MIKNILESKAYLFRVVIGLVILAIAVGMLIFTLLIPNKNQIEDDFIIKEEGDKIFVNPGENYFPTEPPNVGIPTTPPPQSI